MLGFFGPGDRFAAAAAALQLGHSATAARALDEAPEEHRDWEWRHLRSQLEGSRAVMPGGMPFWGDWQLPVISPSGKELAAPDRDERTINIWDATTGAALGALGGHEGPVYALAYSPDGRRLASGAADKVIRLRDPAAGKELAVLRGHEQRVEWLSNAAPRLLRDACETSTAGRSRTRLGCSPRQDRWHPTARGADGTRQ